MIKRIFLFAMVNLLIVITISAVTSIFGIQPYLQSSGLDLTSLMFFCLAWGMGGAFISLGLSRIMAKMMMGVKVIDPATHVASEKDLLNRVYRFARAAGITKMPEVGIYNSPEVNAFATGPTKNRALVAVSSGLLDRMNPDEMDGVLGHEVAHIQNGDMVTMTLIQGVINAFVMFFARIIAFFASSFVKEEMQYLVRFIVTIIFEIAFSFLGMFVVAFFSRYREFRADAGGARLAGKANMIQALQALQRTLSIRDENNQESLATLKISGHRGFMALLSTHPSLEIRIKKLQRVI